MLLGDADVEHPGGVLAGQLGQPGRARHGGGDGDHVRPVVGNLDQLVREHIGPLHRRRGQWLAGLRVKGAARRVQAVLHVVLGRAVAVPLAGDRVHDHRAAEALRPAQRGLHRGDVVPVHRADVLDAQVLEHRLRRHRVLDALLDRVQHLVHRLAHQRRVAHRVLDQVEHLLVPGVEAQRGEVVGEPADGRRVRAAVVVDHDDQRVAGGGDVVQRLPAHPAGERAVTHHGHHVPALATQRVRLGQPVGVGERGGGVRVLDQVVLALRLVRVAGQTPAHAQLVEPLLPASDDLVDVRLVPGVEDQPVARRVEDPVQGERELHHAEVRTKVAAGARHLFHQKVTDFGGEQRQLLRRELLEVFGTVDGAQQTSAHGRSVYR